MEKNDNYTFEEHNWHFYLCVCKERVIQFQLDALLQLSSSTETLTKNGQSLDHLIDVINSVN